MDIRTARLFALIETDRLFRDELLTAVWGVAHFDQLYVQRHWPKLHHAR